MNEGLKHILYTSLTSTSFSRNKITGAIYLIFQRNKNKILLICVNEAPAK